MQTSAPQDSGLSGGKTQDPRDLWPALLEQLLRDKPAMAWLRFLELESIADDRAILSIVPGHREVAGFATPDRLEPVARALEAMFGRRIRVEVQSPQSKVQRPDPRPEGMGFPDSELQAQDIPGARHSGGKTQDASGGSGASGGGIRREVLGLPLVKRVLEVFPDASLVNADVDREVVQTDEENQDEAAADRVAPAAMEPLEDDGVYDEEV